MPLNVAGLAHGVGTRAPREIDVQSSESDIFAPLAVKRDVVDGRNFYIRPVTLSDSGPFDFVIPSDSKQQYLHLAQTRMLVWVSVYSKDSKPMPGAASKKLALVNGFEQALWKNVEIETNGRLQTSLSGNHYAYKAYLETMTSYGRDAFNSHLAYSWHQPEQQVTADQANDFDAYTTTYAGDNARLRHAADGRVLCFSCPLHVDFLHTNRYLPSGINLRLRFHRNSDEFLLFQPEEELPTGDNPVRPPTPAYGLRFHQLMLQVRKLEMSPSVLAKHHSRFAKEVAPYPFSRSVIKTYNIPRDQRSFNVQGLYRGVLPQLLLHTLVNTQAFNGAPEFNPFYLHHYKLNYYQLYHNGKPVPTLPYQPDYEAKTNNLNLLYRDFVDNIGIKHENGGVVITPQRYENGSFMLCHDLTPDHCATYHPHPSSEGDVSLSLTFGADHPGLTLVSMAVYNSVFMIDGKRDVFIDSDISIA